MRLQKHLVTSDALSEGEKTRTVGNKIMAASYDNAPAHNALRIREFLAKNNIAILEQLPYSPDLAPCDFFLFPKLKIVIKGTRFQDSKGIKTAVTRELQAIPQESFQEWVEAWLGDWKSAFKPKEITSNAKCCKIYLPNKIKHL